MVETNHTPEGSFTFTDVEDLEECFKKYVTGKTFLDLGSGDGRVVEYATKFTEYAMGVERLYIYYERSKCKERIINADMLGMDFSKYDVLFYYLGSSRIEHRVVEKLNEFKGILILYTNDCEDLLPGFELNLKLKRRDWFQNIYVYGN